MKKIISALFIAMAVMASAPSMADEDSSLQKQYRGWKESHPQSAKVWVTKYDNFGDCQKMVNGSAPKLKERRDINPDYLTVSSANVPASGISLTMGEKHTRCVATEHVIATN